MNKKIFCIFLFLNFLLVPAFSFATPDITVQSDEVTFLRRMNYHEHLVKQIKKADSRIWISSYVISKPTSKAMKTIYQIVEEKIREEVEVKFVAEKDLEDNKEALEKLEKVGAETRLHGDTKQLHAKLIVIDDKYVYNGSANFSTTAFWRGGETTIFIESEELNSRFKKYFKRIWKEAIELYQ